MNYEKSFPELLSLCLRSRCPVCATGHLFVPLLRVRSLREYFIPPERCEHCGFKFKREDGYYSGVPFPILPILALGTGTFTAINYYLWAHPPDLTDLILPGAIGVLVGFILFLRTSIAFFVSLDHAIDPPEERS